MVKQEMVALNNSFIIVKIEMYSNDEITEKLNQKDDTYYDESEKECNAFLLQYLKENKEHFMKES